MLESISNGIFLLGQVEQKQPSFFQSGTFVFFLLIATVVFGWFLAKVISNGLKLSEYNGRMTIVIISLFVASLMIWAKWAPKLGVDLRGGINIIGSLNLDAFTDDTNSGKRPTAKDIIPALIQRVNPSGTKEIMIRALGEDQIEVTIPSVDDQEADDIWDRLVKTGKLEFRILASKSNDPSTIEAARAMAKEGNRGRRVTGSGPEGETKILATWVNLARLVPADGSKPKVIPFKFVPTPDHLVRAKSTGSVLTLDGVDLRDEDTAGKNLAVWCEKFGVRTPQILVNFPEDDRNVEGKDLKSVSSTTDDRGRGAVSFKCTDLGASKMGTLTRFNLERPMGIVLDGQLHSAPTIQSAIYKNGQITGEFTPEEVEELIINLESGKLDVALNKAPISRAFIESNLGRELKEKGIWAIACSLILVLVFMVLYYRFSGIVATLSLLFNLILILALVMAINQPITLTGLAGLVLTVGMSVDANVLIFERIREELDRGAALRMAIRNGFDKATTTIVDANVTTLITAIVLYVIGTEQIKGFSVTLILGILMSMFTAIYVSRLMFDICERKRWVTKLNMTRILDKGKFNFLNKVGMTGIVSAVLIVAGMAGMYLLGAKILNHDLRGGSTVRMVFNEAQDVEKIRAELEEKNFMHDGEKVEFSVSGFGNSDPEKANKIFKVDSNLPAWEGEGERFPQLNDRMKEVFGERLQLHHVDIMGMGVGQITPRKASRTASYWSAPPTLASMTTSMLAYQETETGTQKMEPQETEETETTPAATEPATEPAPETTTTPDTSQGETPAVETPATDAVGAESLENTFQEPAGQTDLRASEKSVRRTMKVTPAISGKSLHALILDASEEAGIPLEEDQLAVNSDDVLEDESAMTTVSEDWEVTMSLAKEAEADRILTKWSESFNQEAYFPTSSKVGGQIARKTQLQALAAIIASLLGIIAYVWIRFQNVAFGLAAVIALVHDVLIVLGAIALSHWLAGALGFLGIIEFKISLEIVAALLTVIGYSLNDTIVVFDRIREVRGKRTEITGDMINTSISQTLSRTILTSITTFIVVFILYCFGGEAIHGFAFALVIGVLVGTYSSIFVASPALLWLMNTVGLNPGIVDPAVE
ncbi:MAG: protein translocase subunit SecD [Mariniblastus sp.]